MHGLIFETSVCYWQNQPGCYLYYFVVKGNTGAAKKGKMPFPHAGVFSPENVSRRRMQTLKDYFQIGRRSAVFRWAQVPRTRFQPRTPFLPSMRFFETLENEGEFMPKNKRLVKLHVLFDRHFRRASHSAGGDGESATQKQLLWDGTCLVRSASMTLRLH